jgi:type III secretory pathway component EscR
LDKEGLSDLSIVLFTGIVSTEFVDCSVVVGLTDLWNDFGRAMGPHNLASVGVCLKISVQCSVILQDIK